jgi:DNA-binding response OmpR family regulator
MYGHALRLRGYCTLQAPTGATAVRMAEELLPAAVVISEGRLRDQASTTRLRSVLDGSPVIILANYMGTEAPPAAPASDGARVLVKPCVPEDLVRAVDELLAAAR